MLEFLIDNIYVAYGNQVSQQSVGCLMGTTLLLADLSLSSYKAEFIQRRVHGKRNRSRWPSTRHFDISTTYYLLAIVTFILTPTCKSYRPWNKIFHRVRFICIISGCFTKKYIHLYMVTSQQNLINVNSSYLLRNIPSPPAYGVFVS